MKIGLFSGLIFLIFLSSCKDKSEETILLLNPPELYIPAEVSEVKVIEVRGESPFELREFQVKSRIQGDYAETELDTVINGKKFYLQYEYRVPEVIESTDIVLEFSLLDATGERVSNFRIISVKASATYLTETAGHEMYSGHSGKQNAFNLALGIPQYLHLSKPEDIHIADTTQNDTLLNEWISPAGIRFVKFNGFDYANATNITARDAYNAGIKEDFIGNVQEGDIFITKIKVQVLKEIYPVIRISDIIDEAGSENDRYVFSLKK